MRTTLVLDDDLIQRAKQRALAEESTLSDVVNQALREALTQSFADVPHFEMIVFGQTQPPTHHEPADFSAATEDEDVSRLHD